MVCRLKQTYTATIIIVVTPMTLIILTLAATGAARIVAKDRITLPFRAMIIKGVKIRATTIKGIKIRERVIWKGSGVNGWLAYLVHCVTCTGFWTTLAVVGSWLLWPGNRALTAIYLILAVAWLAPAVWNIENRITGGE